MTTRVSAAGRGDADARPFLYGIAEAAHAFAARHRTGHPLHQQHGALPDHVTKEVSGDVLRQAVVVRAHEAHEAAALEAVEIVHQGNTGGVHLAHGLVHGGRVDGNEDHRVRPCGDGLVYQRDLLVESVGLHRYVVHRTRSAARRDPVRAKPGSGICRIAAVLGENRDRLAGHQACGKAKGRS